MRLAALLLSICCAAVSCAVARPKGGGAPVFVDAVPEAAGVAHALEHKLELDGYTIVRGAAEARLALRIDQRSAVDRGLRPGAAGVYVMEVTKGLLSGKQVESLDAACRDLPEPPFECHADAFLRELRDAGVLRCAAWSVEPSSCAPSSRTPARPE
jgi:hypothetical protein